MRGDSKSSVELVVAIVYQKKVGLVGNDIAGHIQYSVAVCCRHPQVDDFDLLGRKGCLESVSEERREGAIVPIRIPNSRAAAKAEDPKCPLGLWHEEILRRSRRIEIDLIEIPVFDRGVHGEVFFSCDRLWCEE